MRVLVVGCGSIGKRHARLLAERTDMDLTVCDALPENLQAAVEQAAGARPVADYAAALAERPDLVFVCTPNHLHRPMAEAALEAGCHVLCEKPLADTVANAEALAQRVGAELQLGPGDAAGLGRAGARPLRGPQVFAVGYSLRSHGGLRRVHEIVRSGVLGTLVGGRAMVGTYFTLMCATTPYRMTEPNALITDYTHLLDYMRLFLGDAERVSAEAATLGDLPLRPQPNLFSLLVRYRSGAVATIHMDYVQHPQRSAVELYGDRGTVTYDFQTGVLQLFDRDGDSPTHAHHVEHILIGRDDIYRVQIETLLEACGCGAAIVPAGTPLVTACGRGDTQAPVETPLATAQDGLAALRLAEAAVLAAKTGRAQGA
jgi:predicted dehydrogenase